MPLLLSKGDAPIELPDSDAYDPQEEKYYFVSYRPRVWQPNLIYRKNIDIIRPPTPNGFMYVCTSSGVSGIPTAIPTFATKENARTQDNTVEWKALPYTAFLGDNSDVINSSDWVGTNGETLVDKGLVDDIAYFKLTGVPVNATTATIVNTLNITRDGGKAEIRERSIIIPVKQL